jgi:hypothetical protein
LSVLLIFSAGRAVFGEDSGEEEPVLVPAVDGDWWQVAGDPDLGDYTDPGQQPVDFAVWQAADGTWQLWSCIRHTRCGGNTRLFYRWEGQRLTDTDWEPIGIAMEGDPKYGESTGGMQAPHVIRHDGVYYMLYGDWNHICLARSHDGKTFQRVLDGNGRPQLFTESTKGWQNTRDPMVLKIGEVFHCYYAAHRDGKCPVHCRRSRDLRRWSDSVQVFCEGPTAHSGRPGWAECPHVVFRHDWYYLIHTQAYGAAAISTVYRSKDPMGFGRDDDRYRVGSLETATVEIFFHEGQEYVATLLPSLKGIQIARLKWIPQPPAPPSAADGQSRFDLDDPAVRARWQQVEGKIDPVFTTSTRHDFRPFYQYFIGTAEKGQGTLDDSQVGVIESPPFRLTAARHVLLVSGGKERRSVYVALVEAGTGRELARFAGTDHNSFREVLFNAPEHVGKEVRLRVVDRATGSWGHVNFGGIFAIPD